MENLQSGNLDYMVRFIIEKHGKQPNWALMLMATFPFDRTKDYPAVERYAMMGVVLDHVESFTYKKRNSMQTLGITHSILCSDERLSPWMADPIVGRRPEQHYSGKHLLCRLSIVGLSQLGCICSGQE